MGRQARFVYNCSFCGQNQDAVNRLIAGPGAVYVCDQCVTAFRRAQARDPHAKLPPGTRFVDAASASPAARDRCAFCGKQLAQVAWMAVGASGTCICDECVALCEEIITEETGERQNQPSGAEMAGRIRIEGWRAAVRAPAPAAAATAEHPARRHLLDLDGWTPDELRHLLARAGRMLTVLDTPAAKLDSLRGSLVVTLFYENSTRTRVSFELAAKKLGADVSSVTTSASSVTKGESLIDTVRTLQALGASVVVVRSPHAGAPDLIARTIRGSVINAGDGWHAHPTQALLDLFTLERHLGSVAGQRIVILGDILHSRVARSNVWALTALGAEVVLCGPPTLLPPAAVDLYTARPVPGTGKARRVTVEPRIERALAGAGAVMALRLQRERQQAGLLPSLREYTARWGLTPECLALAQPGALVLHPGPMNEGVEIDPAVASGPTSVIEEQVSNGVAVRMAVLELLAGPHAPAPLAPSEGEPAARQVSPLQMRGEGGHRGKGAARMTSKNQPETVTILHARRIVEPALGMDGPGAVAFSHGRVLAIGAEEHVRARLDTLGIAAEDRHDVELPEGAILAPGFVDLHAHLREPGYEAKETIHSGAEAAARGGFTTLCVMPNTNPVIDSAATIAYVLQRARDVPARIRPIAAISKGEAGAELSEMAELAAAGAVAFSDDGRPVSNGRLMRSALEYAAPLGLPVVEHCQDEELAGAGVMHEGAVSTLLGLPGWPAAGEEVMLARDLALVRLTGAHYHAAHLSTAGAVALVRRAKAEGLPVTAEVTPHHLLLTDCWVAGERTGPLADALRELGLPLPAGQRYDTNTKVNPPLRTAADAAALLAGLRDGTIDAIATDHAPHTWVDKACEYDSAAFGISGLETALAALLALMHTEQLTLAELVAALTIRPARAWNLDAGTLAEGAPADIAVFDPDAEWTVVPEELASRGKNTPLAGLRLRGRVIQTWLGGRVVYEG